jgi:uncharacterized repeat protein (TIGR03803 family)
MRWHLAVVVTSLAMAAPAGAQPAFDVVHAFGRGPTWPDGRLVEGPDGRFFGTTQAGGTFDGGTVFTFRPGPNGSLPITPLHSFGAPGDGRQPRTGLIMAADGALYGTTYFGGAHGYGTVFRMTLDGAITILHAFDGFAGAHPGALMQARDGFLYGVTSARLLTNGALPFTGTLFRISTSGALTELHQFTGTDGDLGTGAGPQGPLVQAPDGTFYGVTESGGSGSEAEFPLGTIFSLTEAGVFTRLHSFSGMGYRSPEPGLILGADGSLYGTTGAHSVGGLTGPGAMFRRSPDGTVTFIHPFAAREGRPRLHFPHTDGTFIGTTDISVFRVTTSGVLTTVRTFERPEGAALRTVMLSGDGRLYGLAAAGGVPERGTAFGMTFDGTLTAFNPFIVDDQPMQPVGTLVPGADGSVFGVTCRGGWLNGGTVYKRSPEGVVNTVKSFYVLDGLCPFSLIRGADGFMYGTTLFGGLYARGTIFRISDSGAFTLLRMFSGVDGSHPDRLLQTQNGQLWGTTHLGPSQTNTGGVFRISTTGTLGTAFALAPECQAQLGGQAGDGSIYGAMRRCADHNSGSLFRMSEAGAITTFYQFGDGTIGFRPAPPLLASDGKLYGTVEAAEQGRGAIFVSTLAGEAAQLHAFAPGEGEMPQWGLIEGQDGLLYGITIGPGSLFDPLAPDVGTVFSATKSGALTVLHTFSHAVTGGRPVGPLMQMPEGTIFGTTVFGGPAGQGVLFRIRPGGGSE